MTFKVSDFRAQMIGDGARPNLFSVQLVIPQQTDASAKVQFMAKSAQLPGSTIGTANLYYFGREMKFAGNRTFPDWTVTIINDEDFLIRNSLEYWMNSINSHQGNVRGSNKTNSTNYTSDASVVQYTKEGVGAKGYTFYGLFPIDISPIELDWGTNDSIEEFSVTFAYQYWMTSSEITT
jgi:hypothetical protein